MCLGDLNPKCIFVCLLRVLELSMNTFTHLQLGNAPSLSVEIILECSFSQRAGLGDIRLAHSRARCYLLQANNSGGLYDDMLTIHKMGEKKTKIAVT